MTNREKIITQLRISQAVLTSLSVVILLLFPLDTIHSQGGEYYETVDWSPDGSLVVLGTGDGQVLVLSTQSQQVVTSWQVPSQNKVRQVRWNPNGQSIAIGTAHSTTIYIWNPFTNQVDRVLEDGNQALEVSTISLAWSPDGRMIASAQQCDTYCFAITIWDAETGNILTTLEQGENLIDAFAWNSDSTQIAVENDDSLIDIYDTVAWNLLNTIDCHQGVMAISWQKNSPRIATVGGSDESVRICDTETGALLLTIPTTYVLDAEWSPDGSKLALADGSQIRIVNATTGDTLYAFEPTAPAQEVAWSPNGQQLAFASYFAPSIIEPVLVTPTPSRQ